MRRDERGPWYLLTGVVLGFAMSLLYTWLFSPVKYIDTAPGLLRADFKDQYRALIAAAYVADKDLARAQVRLKLLSDPDVVRALTIQAQSALAQGRPDTEVRALGVLALALSQGVTPVATTAQATVTLTATPMSTISPTPVVAWSATSAVLSGTITHGTTSPASSLRTPLPTPTPLPTRTQTPTPGAPFVLKDLKQVCDTHLAQPLIQVETRDAANQPVPGVEVIVSWDGGENHFFTGLKSELSLGYADFTMTPGVKYALRLAEGGQPVPDLTSTECAQGVMDRYWGSLKLVFVQP